MDMTLTSGKPPELNVVCPLTNWAVLVKVGDGGVPPKKEDWSRTGKFEDLMPHVQRFSIP